jgi:hypothetical protein
MFRKSTILMCFSAIFCFTSNAQFKKGTRMVGADIASVFFNSGTTDYSYPAPTTGYSADINSYGLSIIPSMGVFINEHTAAGILININPTGRKTTYNVAGTTFQQDKVNSLNLGAGGFLRNYFKSTGSLLPFGQIGVNLGISSENTSGYFYGGSGASAYKQTYEGKSSGGFFANANATLGMTKMLNTHTGLDLSLGYTYSYTKSTNKTTTKLDEGNNGSIDVTTESNPTIKYTGSNIVLGVGLRIFLEPRK